MKSVLNVKNQARLYDYGEGWNMPSFVAEEIRASAIESGKNATRWTFLRSFP